MKWESAGQFFAMGGYALYVWGSYAVVVAVVAVETLLARARLARALAAAPEPEAPAD